MMSNFNRFDGPGWWRIFRRDRRDLITRRKNEGHLGQSQPNNRQNRCVYATGGYRPLRLRRTDDGKDLYFTNYLRSTGEFLVDPTPADRQVGEDPVYSLMVGVDLRTDFHNLTAAKRLNPDFFIVNADAIEVGVPWFGDPGAGSSNYITPSGMSAAVAARYALALSGEDQYNYQGQSLLPHAFTSPARAGRGPAAPEQQRYGGVVQTQNAFEQRIRIYDPKHPVTNENQTGGPFQPLVRTGLDERNIARRVFGHYPQINSRQMRSERQFLAGQPGWSLAWSAVHYGYTYEYHNFVYNKPWTVTKETRDIEDKAKNVARINPEFNFYDQEYAQDVEDWLNDEGRRFPNILGERLRLRESATNIWLGEQTEKLQSKEIQDKKGQLPFYIELSLPTQKRGPILNALNKAGLERSILLDILRKYDNNQTESVSTIKKIGFLGRTHNNTRTSIYDSFNSVIFASQPGGDERRVAQPEVDTVEFYGSNNSLFNTFYEDVVAGRRQGECGTYRDRIMLMGLRTKIEKILGERDNRITYFETLPHDDVVDNNRAPSYYRYQYRRNDGTYGTTWRQRPGVYSNPYSGENLNKSPCKTETLMYEIIKETSGTELDRQRYFLSNPKEEILNFIDNQVIDNQRVVYTVNAYVAVYGIAYRYNYQAQTGIAGQALWDANDLPSPVFRQGRYGDQRGIGYPILDLHVHYIPSVKIFKVPLIYRQGGNARFVYGPAMRPHGITFDTAAIIQRPPTPPEVSFIPYRGINNKILVNLSDTLDSLGVGHEGVRYYAFSEEERTKFEQIRDRQLLYENSNLKPGCVEFKGEGDSTSIEVYRTTTKPMRGVEDSFEQKDMQPYLVFNIGIEDASPHKTILLSEGDSFKDDLEPNTKYYYTFRTKDKSGKSSNPSPIYLVELVDEDGKMYAITDVYEPEIPKSEKTKNQKLVKYLEISPASISSEVFSTEEQTDRVGLVSGEDSVFGKTFKIRIKSKDTSRMVDLNVKFKTATTVDENLTPSEQEQEQSEECEEVEEE